MTLELTLSVTWSSSTVICPGQGGAPQTTITGRSLPNAGFVRKRLRCNPPTFPSCMHPSP